MAKDNNEVVNITQGAGSGSGQVTSTRDHHIQGMSTNQAAFVYDAISEGPIQGLVAGPSSILLDGTPLMEKNTQSVIGATSSSDVSYNSSTGVITDNNQTLFVGKDTNAGVYSIRIKGAKKTGTVSVTAESTTITSATSLFTADDVNGGNLLQPQAVLLPGAGEGGALFYTVITEVVSATEAKILNMPLTTVASCAMEIDLVDTIASFSGHTATLTNGGGVTVSNVQALINTNITVTDAPPLNFNNAAYAFRSGSRDQAFVKLPGLRGHGGGSVVYPVNQELKATDLTNVSTHTFPGLSSGYEQKSGRTVPTPNASEYLISAKGVGSMGVTNPGEVDQIKIVISFPQGLYAFKPKSGKEWATGVEFQVFFEYTRDGSNYTSVLALGPKSDANFATRRTTNPLSGSPASLPEVNNNGVFRYSVPQRTPFTTVMEIDTEKYQPFENYRLRIRRITPDSGISDDDTTTTWTTSTTIQSISNIIEDKLSYPYTAFGAVSFSAQDFQQIPQRSYHIRGIKCKVPTNYFARHERGEGQTASYTRKVTGSVVSNESTYENWDGTFRGDTATYTDASHPNFNPVWTDNPVWILMDLLTNDRYGLGKFIDPDDDFSKLDKYQLFLLAKYCDELVPDGKGGTEPRFSANVYFTKASQAQKMVKDLLSIFRAILVYNDGKISPQINAYKSPVHSFSKSNVVGGLFTYQSSSRRFRHNQIRVTWNNPDNAYKADVEIVEDQENIAETGQILSKQVVAFGCTSRSQANRYGKWILLTELLETEVVSFATSINGGFLLPGDVIEVQDADRNNARYSGRVSNFDPESGLTLDETMGSGGASVAIEGSGASPEPSYTSDEQTQNVVFAGEVNLPSSFSQDACMWEHGGTGVGSWLGVRSISGVYNLTLRSGEGATAVTETSADGIVSNIPIADIPEFDDQVHTVVWEFAPDTTPGTHRLWIDGKLYIDDETSSDAFDGGAWSGGDEGGWLEANGSQSGGLSANSWPVTAGSSGLRHYFNEVVSSSAYGSSTTEVILDSDIDLSDTNNGYQLNLIYPKGAAYLAQDTATISSTTYNRGDIISGITSQTASANVEDDSGNLVQLFWSENTSVETQTISSYTDITLNGVTKTKVTVSSAFSEPPNPESIWSITPIVTATGQEIENTSPKEYIVTSIQESSEEFVYSINASEYSRRKYDLVDRGYVIDESTIIQPPTRTTVVPAVRNLTATIMPRESGLASASSITGVDLIIRWDPPLSNEVNPDGTTEVDLYPHSMNYELMVEPYSSSKIFVSPNESSYTVENLQEGTYDIFIRVRNTSNVFSAYKKRTITWDGVTTSVVPGVKEISLLEGGKLDAQISINSSGLLQLSDDSYKYVSTAGEIYELTDTGTNNTQQSFSSMSTNSEAFLMFDASATSHHLVAVEEITNTAGRDADGNVLTFRYPAEVGASNSGLTTLTGTVTVGEDSSVMIGSGTSFKTELEPGRNVVLGSGNSIFSARVNSVKNNVYAELSEATTRGLSGVALKKLSLAPDFTKDHLLAKVIKDSSDNYSVIDFTGDLGANAVDGSIIAGNAIEAVHIAANSITSAMIQANVVLAADIQANQITSALIASNAITEAEIAANSITSAMIKADVVLEADIAANQITTALIASNAITSASIEANAVDTAEIASNAITEAKIAANSITSAMIKAGQVDTAEIAANAITNAKIAAGAVDTAEIAACAITNAKIAAGAVDTAQISACAITNAKIAANSIQAVNIDTSEDFTLTVTNGGVGGWTIGDNAIYSGTLDRSEYTTSGITISSESGGSIHAKQFYIDTSGNANFKGTIFGGSVRADVTNPIPTDIFTRSSNQSIPTSTENGAFIDLNAGKFVFGDADRFISFNGSELDVKAVLAPTILDLTTTEATTLPSTIKASAVSSGSIGVDAFTQAVWNEIDSRVGTGTGGFYSTATDNYLGEATKYVSISSAPDHGTEDVTLEVTINDSFGAPVNFSYGSDATGVDVTLEYKKTTDSTYTTAGSTQTFYANPQVLTYTTVYTIDASYSVVLTSGTGNDLEDGTDYDFRVKLERKTVPNTFLPFGSGGANDSTGTPVVLEAREGSVGAGQGDLFTSRFLYHTGDSDTHIEFQEDQIDIDVGGTNFVTLVEGAQNTITLREDVVMSGNLTVEGTTTTIDTANLNVEDNNITLNYSTGNATATAGNAGITIQDAISLGNDATILWDNSGKAFDFSSSITLPDNSRIKLGDGPDLQIYHDGSNSYIANGGNGALRINNGTDTIQLRASTVALQDNSAYNYLATEDLGQGGIVKLYHGSTASGTTEVFRTTSTGVDVTGEVVADSLTVDDITINGSTISDSGDLTFDVGGDITLDADGSDIKLSDGGIQFGTLFKSGNHLYIQSKINNGDIVFYGTDDGTDITALTLDMSAGGLATFAGDIKISKTDPVLTLVDSSGANTDPNGTIKFQEIDGTNNFEINYNGANDRLEFRGLVSSVTEDLVFINRSTTNPLHVLGNITVTGTVDGVDIAARDHDAVTLAGTPDYITISGQTITRNQIDLTTDVTGVLPSANLDSDTAHLSGTQTFTGDKTFTGALKVDTITGNTITGNTINFDDDSSGNGSNCLTINGASGVNVYIDNNDNDSNEFRIYHYTSEILAVDGSGNLTLSGTVDGVDIAARDHDAVTLTGTPDYITISGQTITRNQIDLTSDVTGVLPSANLDADTAHLSGTQTFTGDKTFTGTFEIDSTTNNGILHTITDNTGDTTFTGMQIDYNVSGSDTLTADRTHKGLYVDTNSSASGGNTSQEHKVYGAHIYTRTTTAGTSNQLYGITTDTRSQTNNAQTTHVRGNNAVVYDMASGTGRTQNTTAYHGVVFAQGTGTDTGTRHYYGSNLKVLVDDSNTVDISSAHGLYAEVEIDQPTSAYSISDVYGVRSNIDIDYTSNVSTTDAYLFYGNYGGDLSTITNKYGVYIATNVDNYFRGNVGIGTSNNPSRDLHIVSEGTTTGAAYIYSDAVHTGTTTQSLLSVRSDNASASGTTLDVRNDGTGILFNVQQAGNVAFRINNDASVSGDAIKDEDDMSSNSATHLATQQSIKAYVDANAGTTTTINNNADNRVITGSGTANTLEAESNLTFTGTSGYTDLKINGSSLGGVDPALILRDTASGSVVSTLVITADPTASTFISKTGTSNGAFRFQGDNGTTITTYGGFDSGGDFYVDSTTFYVDVTNNRVGIGTNIPDHILETSTTMGSSPTNVIFLRQTGTNTTGGGGAIRFDTSASNDDHTLFYSSVEGVRSDANNGSSELHFKTTMASVSQTPATRMFIQDDGNVGIATESPGEKLHVAGNIKTTGNLVFDDGQITSDGTNFIFDGASGKEVIVSSARDVRIIIDDNNDDTDNEFQIFKHNDDSASNKILNLTQAGALTVNSAYTFPTADGSANQVLQTDGSGNLSFATVASGTITSVSNFSDNRVLTASGSTTINGEANLIYGATSNQLELKGTPGGSAPARLQMTDSDHTNTYGYLTSGDGRLNISSRNNSSYGSIRLISDNGTTTSTIATFDNVEVEFNKDIVFEGDITATAQDTTITADNFYVGEIIEHSSAIVSKHVSNLITTSASQTNKVLGTTTKFRSMKLLVQATSGTSYHVTEILLIHDGTTVHMTEYATIFTGSSLATFDADISSGNVRLLITPASATSTTFKFKVSGIEA